MSSWLIVLGVGSSFYCLGFLMGFWRLQKNQRKRLKNISFMLVPKVSENSFK